MGASLKRTRIHQLPGGSPGPHALRPSRSKLPNAPPFLRELAWPPALHVLPLKLRDRHLGVVDTLHDVGILRDARPGRSCGLSRCLRMRQTELATSDPAPMPGCQSIHLIDWHLLSPNLQSLSIDPASSFTCSSAGCSLSIQRRTHSSARSPSQDKAHQQVGSRSNHCLAHGTTNS